MSPISSTCSPQSPLDQARQLCQYADVARATHYKMSDRRARAQQWLGGVTIAISAVVSTGILASVSKNPSLGLTLAVIIALIATILTGFQTFYKFGETAEKHRLAAANTATTVRPATVSIRYRDDNAVERADALANPQPYRVLPSWIGGTGPRTALRTNARTPIERFYERGASLSNFTRPKVVY
jgi:hypothetical protein